MLRENLIRMSFYQSKISLFSECLFIRILVSIGFLQFRSNFYLEFLSTSILFIRYKLDKEMVRYVSHFRNLQSLYYRYHLYHRLGQGCLQQKKVHMEGNCPSFFLPPPSFKTREIKRKEIFQFLHPPPSIKYQGKFISILGFRKTMSFLFRILETGIHLDKTFV